jgi:hypothetical protein
MAEAVYLLCALTSVLCAALLYRGFRASRVRLLFWSSLCFMGLALSNMLLFVDLVLAPDLDLSVCRGAISLVSLSTLLFGVVWESK